MRLMASMSITRACLATRVNDPIIVVRILFQGILVILH